MAYKKGIPLTGGLYPMDNGDFPLVEAADVYVDDNSRLSDKLSEQDAAISAKYVKPASGIPTSDLAESVQDSLDAAAGVVDEVSDLKSELNIFGIVPHIEYNRIALARESTSENFMTGTTPALLKGYTVDTYGQSISVKTNANYNIIRISVNEGDVLRAKISPWWFNTTTRAYYIWQHKSTGWERLTLGFNGKSADISNTTFKEYGYTIPSGVDEIIVSIYKNYYLSDGTTLETNGKEAEIITINEPASLTAYDGSTQAPDYVPVTYDYYEITGDVRITRYEDALGDIETVLSSVVEVE